VFDVPLAGFPVLELFCELLDESLPDAPLLADCCAFWFADCVLLPVDVLLWLEFVEVDEEAGGGDGAAGSVGGVVASSIISNVFVDPCALLGAAGWLEAEKALAEGATALT
jgi:hypothetical protein